MGVRVRAVTGGGVLLIYVVACVLVVCLSKSNLMVPPEPIRLPRFCSPCVWWRNLTSRWVAAGIGREDS